MRWQAALHYSLCKFVAFYQSAPQPIPPLTARKVALKLRTADSGRSKWVASAGFAPSTDLAGCNDDLTDSL
jgi:hypothetical protein